MMTFPFHCDTCGTDVLQPGHTGQAPVAPSCCGSAMRRMYTVPQMIVRYDSVEYLYRAYRGEETVPGLTNSEVRATVKSMEEGRKRRNRSRPTPAERAKKEARAHARREDSEGRREAA